MLQTESFVKIVDNSGALRAQCIRIIKGSKPLYANMGNIIIVTLKKVRSFKKIKKSQICKGLIVKLNKSLLRLDGSNIRTMTNGIVLLNKENLPIATRIYGPLMYEMKKTRHQRVLLLSKKVI